MVKWIHGNQLPPCGPPVFLPLFFGLGPPVTMTVKQDAFPLRSLVRDGQTRPHQPRLIVSRSTIPPIRGGAKRQGGQTLSFAPTRTDNRQRRKMLRILPPGEVQELQADIRHLIRASGAASLAAVQLSLVRNDQARRVRL